MNPPKAQTFRTELVLSVATGVVMGERLTIGDIHQLIEWLAGGPVWTHQLGMLSAPAADAAITALGAAWEPFDPTAEDVRSYAARMIAKVGAVLEVAPAETPFHRAGSVVADAVRTFGADRVVVVTPGEAPPHG